MGATQNQTAGRVGINPWVTQTATYALMPTAKKTCARLPDRARIIISTVIADAHSTVARIF